MNEINRTNASMSIDADVISENFHSTLDALDESVEISQSRATTIEQIMMAGEIFLSKADLKGVKRLKNILHTLLSEMASEDEPEEEKNRNRKLLEDMEEILNKLTKSNLKAEKLIKEDQHAFINISDVIRTQSEVLTRSSQGETYSRLLWTMLAQYLDANRITSSVNLEDRPNFFVENSLHLKRIHQIFIGNFSNK